MSVNHKVKFIMISKTKSHYCSKALNPLSFLAKKHGCKHCWEGTIRSLFHNLDALWRRKHYSRQQRWCYSMYFLIPVQGLDNCLIVKLLSLGVTAVMQLMDWGVNQLLKLPWWPSQNPCQGWLLYDSLEEIWQYRYPLNFMTVAFQSVIVWQDILT
jgi:hypothetical protein